MMKRIVHPETAAMVALLKFDSTAPFSAFAPHHTRGDTGRADIAAAYRRAEAECVAALLPSARLPEMLKASIAETTSKLVRSLRAKPRGSGMEGLVHEYSLSSDEGVALMCLAEALLRIPDAATRDALIRDKIAHGKWETHLGDGRPLFVNAATWGLVLTRKITATVDDGSLSAALTKLIARCGEPVIRQGVDMAMRMMGEQFVTGETIGEALKNVRPKEKAGFLYSYDMLGEAAMTAADAARYYAEYETAIHAVGKNAKGRGVYAESGISIKLSALHPRYTPAQTGRVMGELLPRVSALTKLAMSYDIGINIDAEEADRLDLSLDVLEALCSDPAFDGWNGLGFVVQAYGKRAPAVLDWIIGLSKRTGHRIMVRLVKGAYWDTEIKRAQVDGLEDYPVFTRKVHTDISYIACARKLLEAREFVFPQFATHNAQTLAAVYHLAGPDFKHGDYEFQCLHGMGEPLYEEVVGASKLDRPCRIYAPVGTHETLLAYLVRRLLENGANASFVNRIADPTVPVAALAKDPVEDVLSMREPGSSHEQIAHPSAILGEQRRNSEGLDLSDTNTLIELNWSLQHSADTLWTSAPVIVGEVSAGSEKPVLNPANHEDVVGTVTEASQQDAAAAVRSACDHASGWASTTPEARAAILEQAADNMQSRIEGLMGILMREAGKTAFNAIGEVREAVDFLRYYAQEVRTNFSREQKPLGPIVCISPWNFPLAIFTGQIAAALAGGNVVLAKPAEETPLIAAQAIEILHDAGIPREALQFLPGDGKVGAALVGAQGVEGVMFTGSTEVARLIQKQLTTRLSSTGKPIPLIAETGGQNAMIVDSSALAEQVVADVITSAFDSAGQRCSALRVLCLQEDIADRTLAMLKGTMQELVIGNPDQLAVDVGPVIHGEAKGVIEQHIKAMRDKGLRVERFDLPPETDVGTFVAPTIIEIERISDLGREVFGPVLHVIRYRRKELDKLIAQINKTGYGLTFGLHTRLDETIEQVCRQVSVGNVYINRNIVGAVVGVQPFGGRGLSGTGPKAGGPLYLTRLTTKAPKLSLEGVARENPALTAFTDWLEQNGFERLVSRVRGIGEGCALGASVELPGPVGERNIYELHPRGTVALFPESIDGMVIHLASALASGNRVIVDATAGLSGRFETLPDVVKNRIEWTQQWREAGSFSCALVEGDAERTQQLGSEMAAVEGPIVLVQAASSAEIGDANLPYNVNLLLEEVSTSINTAAAGGNASLMAIS